VIRPWLLKHAALRPGARPATVLAPRPNLLGEIRSRIVAENMPCAGVRFLTQIRHWEMLRKHTGVGREPARREDLHLFLSAAASGGGSPVAEAVEREPASLMRALDRLAAAGLDARALHDPVAVSLEKRLAASVSQAGLATAQEIDREMLRRAPGSTPLHGALLMVGFGPAHWPLWNHLRAAAFCSEDATVCVMAPGAEMDPGEESWIASWEELCGEMEPVPASAGGDDSPFLPLADAIETGSQHPCRTANFRLTGDEIEEAAAIVCQTAEWLAACPDARIGVLFPGRCPAARHTSALLSAAGIEHCDEIGAPAPPTPRAERWMAWLAFHARPDAAVLLDMLDRFPDLSPPSPPWGNKDLRRILEHAHQQAPTDDLRVLGALAGADICSAFDVLPESAPFAALLERTDGWFNSRPVLADMETRSTIRLRAGISNGLAADVSRTAFVRWLSESALHTAKSAGTAGGHLHSHVHLCEYDGAEWRSFTHVVLACLENDRWPPAHSTDAYLPPELLRELNTAALRQGRHGDGQRVMQEGRGWIVGPEERGRYARRQFCALVRSPSRGLCFSAACAPGSEGALSSTPGELLLRAWAAARGETLDDKHAAALHAETLLWLNASAHPPHLGRTDASSPGRFPDPSETLKAFEARRDPDSGFGIYEFGLASPEQGIILACTAWEHAVENPELEWLKAFLGVEKKKAGFDELQTGMIIGILAHGLLKSAFGGNSGNASDFRPLPGAAEVQTRMDAAARTTETLLSESFRAAGYAVPFWIVSLHQRAMRAATDMAGALLELAGTEYGEIRSEWTLPQPAFSVCNGNSLPVKGRTDAVLRHNNSGSLLVVDFKTGTPPTMKNPQLAKGKGIQILLYGLALLEPEGKPVTVAALSPCSNKPGMNDTANALSDDGVRAMLNELCRMHATSVFGARGDPRNEYAFAGPYPIAHLRVPPHILAEKADS